MNREPTLDELIDAESGEERQRLQQVHELLLQAGPPPELTPELEAGPTLGTTLQRQQHQQRRRRVLKQRALILLAAALTLALVFSAGYAVANKRGGTTATRQVAQRIAMQGTSNARGAQASLIVWQPADGNWGMTLNVDGLSKLPPRIYYEVYLTRHGRILGSCGTFRVDGRHPVSVSLNAPYPVEPGDSWIVTRQGAGGVEPGQPVLRPVTA